MNPIYLLEPYNAYAPKGKKKHWMEVAEEEFLYHRMAQDAILREALSAQMTQLDSVQDGHSSCATIASPAAGAGAGGVPTYEWFQESIELAGFTFSPSSGGGPLSVSFSNITRTPNDDTFYWSFGDAGTSTAINPTHVFGTGSWNIYLESTSSTGFTSFATSNITISAPVITAAFTRTPATGSAPFTESFTNTTTQTGNGNLTYKWTFGDGGTATLLANSASITHIYDTGSFTAILSVTSSVYPTITASNTATANITGTVPIVTPAATVNGLSTAPAPFSTSFFNTSAQNNGVAISTYKWIFTDGTSSFTTSSITPTNIGFESGSWSVTLEATGSYGTAATITYPNIISGSLPTVTAAGSVNGASTGTAPFTASFFNTSAQTNGVAIATYKWTFTSGSSPAKTSALATPSIGFETGSWTGSLEATGSYGTATRISYNNMIIATAPTLVANFTVDTASGAAPLNVTFSSIVTWVSSSTNPGTLTYNWDLGGSSSSIDVNPTMSYSSSIYSVSLTVTESIYSITATKTSASFISASVP